MQIHGQIQRCLTAHCRKDGIRLFLLDDGGDVFRCDGFDVGSVRQIRIRHDGGGIGIHQDDPVALFLQCPRGLSTGIVEFARLPDDDGSGADDQNRFYVSSLWHYSERIRTSTSKANMKRAP